MTTAWQDSTLSKKMCTPSDDSDTSETRCYFLELPVELRLQIYELLLKPRIVCIGFYDEPTILDMDEDNVARSCFYAQSTEDLHPQLLHASSEVYKESRSILYQPDTGFRAISKLLRLCRFAIPAQDSYPRTYICEDD